MNKTQKNLLIGLIVLTLLVPLGLLATGTAFGEWSSEDLEKESGYVPSGVAQGEEIWKAPLPDYALPNQKEDIFHSSIGYYASAIIGMALTIGIMLLAGHIITKREK